MSRLALTSNSSCETEELGRRLGSILTRGTFIALHGELGSGKTCFTRGVVAAAAPESAHLVASPTFAIMNEYPGTVPIYHFDFYRLTNCHEIAELGFDEYLHDNGICIAEWSERLGELLPPEYLSITFEHAGDDQRQIVFASNGPETAGLLKQLAALEKPDIFSLT